ncbi:hypothetical protein [Variovorax soli]|uniref:ElaB/YqjD/DUF883 family membrane-anchored ribosome-binding protein n=1 Tax=Variovorax soli TaxID=376815 RepID=A0ABU1NJP1_9BURK|nr:hypothetical protein [Variovorax soli]MDR6538656.1 ElaB/YqjD/DUF883 family membrane-anchored ribosome-binding protein [Variovorax soli]
MNDPDQTSPTIADEGSAVVDDAQVIAKTLPAAPAPTGAARLQGQVDHALDAVRSYVVRQPMQAVAIAALGGAVLSALVSSRVRTSTTCYYLEP